MRRGPVLLQQGGRWALAVACVAVLTACAAPEWQKLGAPATEVQQSLGAPHVRVTLPDGGERWVYSRQPAGQEVFHLLMGQDQRLQRIEQVLDEAHFSALRPGVDMRETVYQYFGKPALVEGVANFKGDIWTYRINVNNFNRQAHVFIDPQHVVQRVMFTDEPRVDDDRRP